PAHTVIATTDTEFNLFLIEVARGCGRHCRFCMAGYCFREPRNRSLEQITKMLELAKAQDKKVGLMGAAISDYPQINALCQQILSQGMPMSVASFRADSVTKELVDSLAASGLKTLTMAPEAGSEKLRRVINKGIEKEHLFHAVKLGTQAGIRNFRLYIMIGLPFEDSSDIEAIVDLANEVKDYMESLGNKGMLTLSVNPFVPKPLTPFQWLPMGQMKQIEQNMKYIQAAVKRRKNLDIIVESPKEAYVQGVLARGDRRLGAVLLDAHLAGGSKRFKSMLKAHGLDEGFYLYRQREVHEIFPWDSLDMGFSRQYLYDELLKASGQKATPRCFDGCRRCGVCKDKEDLV
ncbi:MAG: radical SAM protein, partial [Selenomonadaceae bacterium]